MQKTEIRKRGKLVSLPTKGLPGNGDWEPELVALANEERSQLDEAINALPAEYQVTIWLYYYSDLDIKAIAKALSISEGTVKSRLFRARRGIARQLQDLPAAQTQSRGDQSAT